MKKPRFAALMAAIVLTAVCAMADGFVHGSLYNIIPAGGKLQVGAGGGLQKADSSKADTYWTLSELSGSWRIINPFTGMALRANGRDAVNTGENNGSDEAQLWTVSDAGKGLFTLSPTNNPDRELGVGGGRLILTDKGKGSRFAIAAGDKAGFDDAATYRFRPATMPEKVLGSGDSGDNGLSIVAEEPAEGNRGQYWNVKMTGLDDREVTGAFYSQNWDDGGGNASITDLIQWMYGGNITFNFVPVDGGKAFVIVSKGRGCMYRLGDDGRLANAPLDLSDRRAWFMAEEVEKPKIESPVWEDEQVFGINKLPTRATFTPFGSKEEMAARGDRLYTPWLTGDTGRRKSLNGTWKFHLVPEPGERPADFWANGFDASGWAR